MTLFITSPNRRFEISDLYVMIFTCLLFFYVTRVVTGAIKKLAKRKKELKLSNIRGGGNSLQLSDDDELALTILSCIADEKAYIVLNPKIKELVFTLVKEKIKNQSLVITPNLMRFLALRLLNRDQTLLVKIGNVIFSSSSRARLFVRVGGSAIIGIIGSFITTLPYVILLVLLSFDVTHNCGYDCSTHFDDVPQETPIQIYSDNPAGHLIISDIKEDREIQIYHPVSVEKHKTEDHIVISKKYKRSEKKFKEVKFSDFKDKDPLLSQFKDLTEPEIAQKTCLMNEIHDDAMLE